MLVSPRLAFFAAALAAPSLGGAAAGEPMGCHGEFVRVADGASMTWPVFFEALKPAALVAFGERHGVLAHPQSAACALTALSRIKPVTLVVEHVTTDKQPIIDDYRKTHPNDANGLGDALDWNRSGWPKWSVYEPLFQAAIKTGSTIRAGDRPKQAPRPLREEVLAKLGEKGENILNDWQSIMADAHCGMINEAQAKTMAAYQGTRDLAMAESIVKAKEAMPTPDSAVVFYSGNTHARIDQAVPYLAREQGVKPAIAVSLQEITDGGQIIDRTEVLAQAKGRYDFIWFIGKGLDIDPCANLTSERMKQVK